jgi:enoyl-CoA hydratase
VERLTAENQQYLHHHQKKGSDIEMRVTYEVTGSVATITMNDGKVNALSFEMLAELNEALDRAESDSAAAMLTGREGLFSAGFDLKVLTAGGSESARLLKTGFELSYRLLSFPLPVVIACSGHAFAMGVFILLSGDYRLGVVDAEHKITANEVAIGMTMPRAAIEVCRQRVSQEHIDRVVVLAEIFNPNSAVATGLLDEVVPAQDLLESAQAKASQLMALKHSAFVATKLRIRAGTLSALRSAIEADDEEMGSLLGG